MILTIGGICLGCLGAVALAAMVVTTDAQSSDSRDHAPRYTRGFGPRTVGSGVLQTVTRPVTSFTGVTIDLGADVSITIGDSFLVEITADDNLLEKISTRVRAEELVIDMRGSFSTNQVITIRIVMPSIEDLQLSGSGACTVSELKGERLDIDLDGSAEVELSGSLRQLVVEIDGSGTVDAERVETIEADVEVNGSGDIIVNVEDRLDASIAGSGSITYTGSPRVFNRDISGSGSIRRKSSN